MKASTKQYVDKIAGYLKKQPVIRAWLFGSYSRGDETADSDIDLLVDYDKSSGLSLLKVCGMMIDLEDLLGKKVDMIENGRLMPFATESANRDKILIYERPAQRYRQTGLDEAIDDARAGRVTRYSRADEFFSEMGV